MLAMTSGGEAGRDGRAMDQVRMAEREMKEKSTNRSLARKSKALMTIFACAAVNTRYF